MISESAHRRGHVAVAVDDHVHDHVNVNVSKGPCA
jgi:hypothetical protein